MTNPHEEIHKQLDNKQRKQLLIAYFSYEKFYKYTIL